MRRRIRCIVREDSNDRKSAIYKIGGLNWRVTVDEAFVYIKCKKDSFYVEDEEGNEVNVIVVEGHNGSKHFRTTPDESMINNLENLPSCDEYEAALIHSISPHTSKQL